MTEGQRSVVDALPSPKQRVEPIQPGRRAGEAKPFDVTDLLRDG